MDSTGDDDVPAHTAHPPLHHLSLRLSSCFVGGAVCSCGRGRASAKGPRQLLVHTQIRPGRVKKRCRCAIEACTSTSRALRPAQPNQPNSAEFDSTELDSTGLDRTELNSTNRRRGSAHTRARRKEHGAARQTNRTDKQFTYLFCKPVSHVCRKYVSHVYRKRLSRVYRKYVSHV